MPCAFAAAPPTFPERSHISALTLTLGLEQELAILRWGRWAVAEVDAWSDTRETGDWDASEVLRSVARRAVDEVGT